MIILKFGGSSVASATQIRQVLNILAKQDMIERALTNQNMREADTILHQFKTPLEDNVLTFQEFEGPSPS